MNMSHCRFENTLKDLRDCTEHMDDELSETEERCRTKLIELIKDLSMNYCHLVEDEDCESEESE